MKKYLVLAALMGLSTSAYAQTASVDSSGVGGVVRQCEIVSRTNSQLGTCVGSTGSFLDGVGAAALEDTVADLVLQLVPLAIDDPACDEIDDEIARAIRLAATYSSGDQAARLLEIADAVDNCDDSLTAAVGGGTPPPGGGNTLAPTLGSPS
jgi:hypothetical protein